MNTTEQNILKEKEWEVSYELKGKIDRLRKEFGRNVFINKLGIDINSGDYEWLIKHFGLYCYQLAQKENQETKNIIKTAESAYELGKQEAIKKIRLARACMVFKLIKCDNRDCLNLFCPLNKKYD